jgi:eukaryotic-like serine/threonine-protein kinase
MAMLSPKSVGVPRRSGRQKSIDPPLLSRQSEPVMDLAEDAPYGRQAALCLGTERAPAGRQERACPSAEYVAELPYQSTKSVNSPLSPPTILDPAHHLCGHVLDEGWRVLERVERPTDATGGHFSVGYHVEDPNGRRAFLKALDYAPALRGDELAVLMRTMTEGYLFERRVLDECERRGMSRIVRVLAAGTIVDESFGHSVDYLIFEPANGDVRTALDGMDSFDTAWALTVSHHAAVALQQLHRAGVAHQDVKPSNLLTFGEWLAKLGDLGRCSQKGTVAPHDLESVRGDRTYAPPELLYGQVDPDWSVRCQACDWYLLGSLILFIFTRTQTTGEILRRLPATMCPQTFGGALRSRSTLRHQRL